MKLTEPNCWPFCQLLSAHKYTTSYRIVKIFTQYSNNNQTFYGQNQFCSVRVGRPSRSSYDQVKSTELTMQTTDWKSRRSLSFQVKLIIKIKTCVDLCYNFFCQSILSVHYVFLNNNGNVQTSSCRQKKAIESFTH